MDAPTKKPTDTTRADDDSPLCPSCRGEMRLAHDGYAGSVYAHGGAGSRGEADHHYRWTCDDCDAPAVHDIAAYLVRETATGVIWGIGATLDEALDDAAENGCADLVDRGYEFARLTTAAWMLIDGADWPDGLVAVAPGEGRSDDLGTFDAAGVQP